MKMSLLSVSILVEKHRHSKSSKVRWRIEEELNQRERLIPHRTESLLPSGQCYVYTSPYHDWHLNPPLPK